MSDEALEILATETRLFPPSREFANQANAKKELYEQAQNNPLEFWDEQADRLQWDTRWQQTIDWSDAPVTKWFVG